MFSKRMFLPMLLMAAAGAEAQSIGKSDVGQVPAGVIAGGGNPDAGAPAGESAAAAETRKRAAAANFLPIVRGRLPLLFVHALRFDKTLLAMGNKDVAAKFATSVGKVFDIRKGRNFTYITEAYKPSAEDVTAAQAWIEQVGAQNAKGQTASGDKTVMQTTLDAYKQRGLATASDVAALAATKATAKGTAPAAATGTATAPAVNLPKSDEKVKAGKAKAEDLLS